MLTACLIMGLMLIGAGAIAVAICCEDATLARASLFFVGCVLFLVFVSAARFRDRECRWDYMLVSAEPISVSGTLYYRLKMQREIVVAVDNGNLVKPGVSEPFPIDKDIAMLIHARCINFGSRMGYMASGFPLNVIIETSAGEKK